MDPRHSNDPGISRGKFGLVVFALCLVGFFMVYRAGDDPDARPDARTPATTGSAGRAGAAAPAVTVEVDRVVDGDTAKVFYGGRSEYVRYIGIDTPEVDGPDGRPACFSGQATDRNASLLEAGRVRLVFDRELRDRFGRLLAYVYVSDVMLNEELLRGGYAQTLTIPPNDAKSGHFVEIEEQAQNDDRGLWAECG